MKKQLVGMGVMAAALLACGGDLAEEAGEMVRDAGELIADAGAALADAGGSDASAQVADASVMQTTGGELKVEAIQVDCSIERTERAASTTTDESYFDTTRWYAEVDARTLISASGCDKETWNTSQWSAYEGTTACKSSATNACTGDAPPASLGPVCGWPVQFEATAGKVRVRCGEKRFSHHDPRVGIPDGTAGERVRSVRLVVAR